MKSITVHGIDEETAKLVRKRAKDEGRSVNRMMKDIIGRALGLQGPRKDHREEFVDLCGVWTAVEADQFLERTAELGVVDRADWE